MPIYLINSKRVYFSTNERKDEFYESLTDLNRGYKQEKVSQSVQKSIRVCVTE